MLTNDNPISTDDNREVTGEEVLGFNSLLLEVFKNKNRVNSSSDEDVGLDIVRERHNDLVRLQLTRLFNTNPSWTVIIQWLFNSKRKKFSN